MKEHSSLADMTKKSRSTGMFAYMIWDNIRNDSKKKAKIYDLQKELQVNIFIQLILTTQ